MRDEQVRRYARHILLPDVGGRGQTALLVASARFAGPGEAERIAASYLAAGGVGTIVIAGATPAHLAALAANGPDTTLAVHGEGTACEPADAPAWWPSTMGDEAALAFWRGGLAATRWMATIANG